MNLAYWIYGRLDVGVARSDLEVAEALREYADAHVKGGREAITDEHVRAVLKEHHDAQALYGAVATGDFGSRRRSRVTSVRPAAPGLSKGERR